MRYCFLDLETTGLDAKRDSIIEISFIIQDESGKEFSRYDEVIIPEQSPLTKYVSHMTGITLEEISERGKSLNDEREKIKKMIGDAIITGHNINFDIDFLEANEISLKENPRLDTHELARIVLVGEESYSLEILSEKYKFTHENAHRALSDVVASIELFTFLKEKIHALPTEFLQAMRPFLEQGTNWFAKKFFLEARGGTTQDPPIKTGKTKSASLGKADFLEKYFPQLSPSHSLFVRQGDSLQSAKTLFSVAESLISSGEKVLILSPKLDFFPETKKFPTPEVLLDPDRLQALLKKEEVADDTKTVFLLQCAWRHFLGFRGQKHFDLFVLQYALWDEICVIDEHGNIFANVLQKCENEKIIAASPYAFLRFHHLPLFQKRTLLVDESEIFAKKMLFAPTVEISLLPFLENKNTATATQFFTTNFCREVVEPHLNHAITPFPEKILLKAGDTFPDFSSSVQNIAPGDAVLKRIADFLSPTKGARGAVRWIQYDPLTGNISFSSWEQDAWVSLRKELEGFKKIFFHRYKTNNVNPFFRVFLGAESGEFVEDVSSCMQKELVIPKGLESAADPKFNQFCTEKIIELAREFVTDESALAVNFSSLATLKSIFDGVSEHFLDSDISVLGEKVSGGDSKLLSRLRRAGKVILFTQRILSPELSKTNFVAVLMQKFPFDPPHPLLKELETIMKQSGQNFWDAWTIPIVAAEISRRISVFSSAKKIIWIDPRENALWGKEILKRAF